MKGGAYIRLMTLLSLNSVRQLSPPVPSPYKTCLEQAPTIRQHYVLTYSQRNLALKRGGDTTP